MKWTLKNLYLGQLRVGYVRWDQDLSEKAKKRWYGALLLPVKSVGPAVEGMDKYVYCETELEARESVVSRVRLWLEIANLKEVEDGDRLQHQP